MLLSRSAKDRFAGRFCGGNTGLIQHAAGLERGTSTTVSEGEEYCCLRVQHVQRLNLQVHSKPQHNRMHAAALVWVRATAQERRAMKCTGRSARSFGACDT